MLNLDERKKGNHNLFASLSEQLNWFDLTICIALPYDDIFFKGSLAWVCCALSPDATSDVAGFSEIVSSLISWRDFCISSIRPAITEYPSILQLFHILLQSLVSKEHILVL